MGLGSDLSHIYNLRKDFTIVALTGPTASGCGEVADQLSVGFEDGRNFTNPQRLFREAGNQFTHNAFRKLRIVYEYGRENFKPYTQIRYKDVISLYILKESFRSLTRFLTSDQLALEFNKSSLPSYTQANGIDKVREIELLFDLYTDEVRNLEISDLGDGNNAERLYRFFFSDNFRNFSDLLHRTLGKDADLREHTIANRSLSYHKMMQIISNNLRRCGAPYDFEAYYPAKIFTIAEAINTIIKCFRQYSGKPRCQVVINSLKNPFEILFFKQRYAAFYAIGLNSDEDTLRRRVWPKFTMTDNKKVVEGILKEEHDGGKDSEFFKQNIAECLQLADIHIGFLSEKEVSDKNARLEQHKKTEVDNTSPYFTWNDQLLKFVSLIDHPGLITPSPEERCMQLAYTAKHNSGCISRHVGAAITDEHYSVRAIGWNNTPEGQVPCNLRKVDDLLNMTPESDLKAFTHFEMFDEDFQNVLRENFGRPVDENRHNLKGRNVCFCFKSLRNSYAEGKNQVHTRSLHAEESAFLQITKYGGTGIKGGKLFSTASPCELCAKKAYQLGIRVIYYIDPYPGISMDHILRTGNNPIDVRLFTGAIGNAYHWLYDPFMPLKDEIALLVDHEVKDIVTKFKRENDLLKKEIENLRNQRQ